MIDKETFIIIISILGSFTIIYLIFKSNKLKSPFRRLGFWIVSIIASIIIGYIIPFIISIVSFFTPYPSTAFSSRLWQNDESNRVELIDDLMDKHLLDSLTHTRVIELLGEPIQESAYFKKSGRDMIYCLGPERHPFGVDSEWLLIWLENDKVIRYEVWTD